MEANRSWENLFGYLKRLQAGDEHYRVVGERLLALVQRLALYDDRPEQHSGGLVHYTSWEKMLNILEVEEGQDPLFRMYNYEMANDPEEGNIKPLEWIQVEQRARDLCREFGDDSNSDDSVGVRDKDRKRSTYGCSFSTNGKGVEDDLMFWRLYGGDGNGCSLKLGTWPTHIYKVRYMGKDDTNNEMLDESEVTGRLDHLLEYMKQTISKAPKECRVGVCKSMKRALDQVLEGYFHLVKSDAYQHEQEWRMISVNPDEKFVKYSVGEDRIVRRYIEGEKMKNLLITGSQITLGPRVSNIEVARRYVQQKVREHGMNATIVRISSRNYRRS